MTSSLRYQVRRVSSSFWTLRGKLTSRRPHTAMYNDGPSRRASVSVFAKPTSFDETFGVASPFNPGAFFPPPHPLPMGFNRFGRAGRVLGLSGWGVAKEGS